MARTGLGPSAADRRGRALRPHSKDDKAIFNVLVNKVWRYSYYEKESSLKGLIGI